MTEMDFLFERCYFDNGQIKEIDDCRDPNRQLFTRYYENGVREIDRITADGATQYILYYPSGTKKAEGTLDESWNFYYPDGTLITTNDYSSVAKTLGNGSILHEAWVLHLVKNMATPSYLEGLTAINWGHLESFFGNNLNVPFFIKGLTSNDTGLHNACINYLEIEVLHQGTIKEITAYGILFLIKILEHAHKAREIIMSLLPYLVQDYFYSYRGCCGEEEGDNGDNDDGGFQGIRAVRYTKSGTSVHY